MESGVFAVFCITRWFIELKAFALESGVFVVLCITRWFIEQRRHYRCSCDLKWFGDFYLIGDNRCFLCDLGVIVRCDLLWF